MWYRQAVKVEERTVELRTVMGESCTVTGKERGVTESKVRGTCSTVMVE